MDRPARDPKHICVTIVIIKMSQRDTIPVFGNEYILKRQIFFLIIKKPRTVDNTPGLVIGKFDYLLVLFLT